MNDKILSIDGSLKVKTQEKQRKEALMELIASRDSGKILTGVISGVELLGEQGQCVAVVYLEGYKVYIPIAECIYLTVPSDSVNEQVYGRNILSKRLNSEIDYVVKVIDEENGMVVASRMEAMLRKRVKYFLNPDKNGNYIISEGDVVEARIVCVIRGGIIVEIFGCECLIKANELSYQRILDASERFYVGDRILVKISSIVCNKDDATVTMEASVKQAKDNPYDKALKYFNEGDLYIGTVSMIDRNGVFVSLDGGVDVLCKHPDKGPRPMRGAKVTVRISLKNEEEKRLFGIITYTAKPI